MMETSIETMPKKITRTADRTLDILLCFTSETPALSMTQISEMVGINKSTVHRLLATLEEKRFVRREPGTGIYRLGFRLLQMASLALEGITIRNVSLSYMKVLVEEFRETVDLAVLEGDEIVFVDSVESPQRVKLASYPGQHLPAYNTASGKAILAYLPQEEAIRNFYAFHPSVHTQMDESLQLFIDDITESKKRGYALDCETFEQGITAIAAPIFGKDRKPIASLAIAGPAYRLECTYMSTMSERLKAVTKEISERMIL